MRWWCLLLCFPAALWAAEREINVAIGEWPPFMGAGLPGYGPVAQLVAEAFAEVDVAVAYGFYPWKRSLLLAKQGRWHATAVWGKTPQREQDFHYSQALFSDQLILISRQTWPVQVRSLSQDFELLCHKRIAVALGSEVLQELRQLEGRGCVQLVSAADEASALEMLLKKRVDALYVNRRAGRQVLAELPAEQRQQLRESDVLGYWHYYVLFSRQQPQAEQLRDLFDQGFSALQARGRVQELLAPLHLE